MDTVMLCHYKKAVRPYYMADLGVNINTIEELGYYLNENLYLIEKGTIGEPLCDWLEQELELAGLAEKLKTELREGATVTSLVVPILIESGIYTPEEIADARNLLQLFRNRSESERRKFRADMLLGNKRYYGAIREYGMIIEKPDMAETDRKLLAEVWHNLGTAYSRLFLFAECANAYKKAYELQGIEVYLRAYLTASCLALTEADYNELLEENPAYRELGVDARARIDEYA